MIMNFKRKNKPSITFSNPIIVYGIWSIMFIVFLVSLVFQPFFRWFGFQGPIRKCADGYHLAVDLDNAFERKP